jgi:NTE family protein
VGEGTVDASSACLEGRPSLNVMAERPLLLRDPAPKAAIRRFLDPTLLAPTGGGGPPHRFPGRGREREGDPSAGRAALRVEGRGIAMAYPFRNLVFEGGGVKGIAYVGAMGVLEQRGILQGIQRVGGTSAGAMNAVLLGLNYAAAETKDILWGLNFRNFLDDSWGVIRDTNRLLAEFGWYKGDYFRNWIGEVIRAKTGNSESTFKDVADRKAATGFRDLYFIGTNLSTRFAEIFSPEHTPRMCIADAVRISMSIPLFFAAKRSLRGDVYVDGGVLDNYPVKLFDREKYVDDPTHRRYPQYYADHNASLAAAGMTNSPYVYNRETLGFRLDSADEIAVFRDHAEPVPHAIDDFFSYAWALIDTILESQASEHLHSDDWQRTVYIDTLGVKTTDFGLDDQRKTDLLASGRQHAESYFTWYDDPANAPVNRP